MSASVSGPAPAAILYARFSPRPNAETESARHQLERCRAEARRLGLSIRGEFVDELASGADCKRDGFLAAIEACRPGDELISDKVDRFARDTSFGWEAARKLMGRGCTLRFVLGGFVVEDNPYSRAAFRMCLSQAEFERDMIVHRTSTAMKRHQQSGRLMCDPKRPPYGYRAVNGRLVPEPSEQRILDQVLGGSVTAADLNRNRNGGRR